MKSSLIALASILSVASAAPAHGNPGCVAPAPVAPKDGQTYKLRINAKAGDNTPDTIVAYNGYFVSRRTEGNQKDQATVVQDVGDKFTKFGSEQTEFGPSNASLRSADGYYLHLDQVSSGNIGLVEYSQQDDSSPQVQDNYLIGSGNKFGGWLICSSQYGPYIQYVATGFPPKNEPGAPPCGSVGIDVVPA